MLTLEQIQEQLKGRVLLKVAEESGVHYHTVRNYALGRVARPSYEVLQKLSEYLSK
jgi:transcriptional regulator with XRE-family HTH domain